MNDEARTNIGTPAPASESPAPEELRAQIERTRDELGKTVEALAAKTDIKARAKQKAAAVKEQAAEKATLVSDQIRTKTERAAHLVKDKTTDPDPLFDPAGRAATAARANRTPLLVAAGAALVVVLLVRRGRGRRR
ncbi:hypothetical protein EES41_34545 [Streptomyces sp. ADI95-16]|uniref:DUF3618 domain-containing protein n=1 Tax=Streptomyces sp. ADI95-16 TaxID=1522758 RepID=UPI000F3AA0F6|nr:DUF3618 domain-containing protein [Streptomyces sp. ADI95-16]AYV31870.1 hypothetical protein EES41_34545 [Streptomyces sp. ADI95-16]